MYVLLMLASGLFWIATYLLIIRQGFADKTYGMPLAALAANLSWEFIFSFVLPHKPFQRTIDVLWFALDLLIAFQLVRYGPREFADLRKGALYGFAGLVLVTAFCMVLFVSLEFHDPAGAYAAFGQNLLMSVLFVVMLYRRRSLRGQSLTIAVCKLSGTACASLAFYLFAPITKASLVLPFMFVAIFGFDLLYVGLVFYLRQQSREHRERLPAVKNVASAIFR
ncbi:hypothetical protein [Gloeobacter kilaueensis]|uniref:Uncharacterized protein n=1 Tax=Gloeobacter kilaueensis (strain ATCC BAA-2537 / CCAP 1431/1 / ULC 316 / JS1) TaxID=1183438 RepID=U5QIF9_GLOK1|nr:hypothetical protein [Gloeobacter kilaueensis]AGY57379.1 hypothetical protein GKIL_1133 [Gloeobacter kilaueensis JS1]